ncbi:MAG: helix-turn-helix domain-containing protein [Myxococcota bacterium]
MNRVGPKLHGERPKVVAFGGGKGGTGRSTLCAETARSIARHGNRVLCIDASWSCPTLNVLLHAEEPRVDFKNVDQPPIGHESAHVADFIVDTKNAQIWLMSIASARQFPYVRPRLGADVFLSQLHELDFEWILIDLPAGLDPFHVGLFTLSDVPLLTCTPEPAAVRLSTQYLRSAFYQAIGYHPDAHEAPDAVLEMLYEQPLNMNLETLLESARRNEAAHDVVLDTARRFEPYVVVNLVREGAERDLGSVLCHAWYEELNIFPRMLTSVDYEDRRWFYNRRTTGTGPSRGDEAFSKDTEALARRMLDISLVDARFPRPVPTNPDAHPAVRLGISPDIGRSEVRQHCRRLWEGYRRESTIGLVFSDPDKRMEIAEELEKLYRKVLTMPNESFTADESWQARSPVSPGKLKRTETPAGDANEPGASEGESGEDAAAGDGDDQKASKSSKSEKSEFPGKRARRKSSSSGTGPDLDLLAQRADTAGELLTELRRLKDMSLQELSLRTHIGIKYLAAIEDIELDVLPRQVYLRGYLREIARIFDVEAQPLIELYFHKLNEGDDG